MAQEQAEPKTEAQVSSDLFRIRDQVESLTKVYIENLVASRDSLASQTKFLSVVLDSVGDGLIVFDKDGTITLANESAIKIAGANMRQLTRKEFISNFHFFKDDRQTPLPENEEPYYVALKERRPAQMEGFVTAAHLPPEGVWVRANAAPIIDDQGDIIGVVTVFHNITERRRLQTQRDSLITLITHDLKNHLAGESIFLSVLQSGFASAFEPEELKQLLSDLKESSEKFLTISSTLMELCRTDLSTIAESQTETDLLELLDSVIKMNSPSASVRDVTIKLNAVEPIPAINGTPSVLHQIFHNLVQNATRVSPVGDAVEIVVSSTTSHIVVKVKDNGPGIPREQVEKLFLASQVATKLPTSSFSTGFALYLCRVLIDSYGGKISCESEVGVGTIFIVELPLTQVSVERSECWRVEGVV